MAFQEQRPVACWELVSVVKLETCFIRITKSFAFSLGSMTNFGRKVHQFPVAVMTNHYQKSS